MSSYGFPSPNNALVGVQIIYILEVEVTHKEVEGGDNRHPANAQLAAWHRDVEMVYYGCGNGIMEVEMAYMEVTSASAAGSMAMDVEMA